MTPINFAYDGEVLDYQLTWHWHVNSYDKKFYPTNGIWKECYYDYHAPLQTVLENNGIPTKDITMEEALSTTDPFVYVLTYRYLGNTIHNHHARNGIKRIPDNYNFFEHLPIGLIKAVNSGKCLLILNDAHESLYYSKEFYILLKDKLNRAGINFNNVLLLSGNANNELIDDEIKLIHWQYFETAMRMAYTNKLRTVDDLPCPSNLKKFLCLNRVPREIRYYFMYQMLEKNIISEFNASLKKIDYLSEIISYNKNEFIDKIKDKPTFKSLLGSLPWIIDTHEFNSNHWDNIDYDFKSKNLIFITTETLFSSDSFNLFLTEKTFKPIALSMPFIVLSNPYTLKKLRSMGYKTFDTLWDESYDEEFDCHQRMEKIIKLVEDINNKYSTEELFDLIYKNKHIMEHNYNLLMERKPEQEVINFIKEKICK
jgi:hypothetical protein